ncbi:alpha/beta hydrolase [Prauserella shujinwangii]|nr:alpha/beta hydrolase [Prauserella shujinwangii]
MLIVGAAPVAVPGSAAAAFPGAAQAPSVSWGPCTQDIVGGVPAEQRGKYSCATYRVPVDHDNAALGTLDLALMRRAANKPDQRIGSLFLNPGGPGGPGRTLPLAADEFLEPTVLDRFDVIGFDPRGVGASTPMRCFTTAEDADELFSRAVPAPRSLRQITDTLAAYRDYGSFCERNGGALLRHMSTADVARDLDRLRAAVGDDRLSYVGFSYGTLLGATYANLFPDRARALVLDGNVDPALRTGDGLRYDRERADGFQHALDEYLEACERARDRCAFSEGNPARKFRQLLERLRERPVNLPDGTVVNFSSFVGGVGGALYSPAAFTGLAEDLQQLYEVAYPPEKPKLKAVTGRDLGTLLEPAVDPRHDVRPDSAYRADDAYFAVNCADKPFRNGQDSVPELAGQWEGESPVFGRYQAFADPAGCPAWPSGTGAYRGPWNAETEHPVLVIGNYHDPATQYAFAERMADQLGHARLLPVDAFGHCILGSSSGVDKAVADYLVNLTVPEPGVVYEPDEQPFAADPA